MQSQMDRFEAWFIKFNLFLAALVAISIGLIAVLIPLNLLLVKTHTGSIWWLNEGIEYTLYVGVFIGAPWVLQQGAHVRVDVLTSSLSERASLRLERLMDLAGFALCALLCFYGVRAAIIEWQDGTLPDKDLRIENWIMMSVFAICFALLAIEFLLRLRRAREAAGKPAAVAETGF